MDARRARPRRHHDRHRRRAARPATTRATAATSSTASRARSARPRRSPRSRPTRPLDVVIDLEVPARRRARSASPARRVCDDCGANYSVDAPPRYGWVCDNCGGDVVQRDDDTAEAIRPRLDLYERRDRAAHRLVRRARACSSRSTALGTPDEVFAAADRRDRRAPRGSSADASRRAPTTALAGTPSEIAHDAPGRPGRGRDARVRSARRMRPGRDHRSTLDRIGREVLDRRGARSNFLGYHGFPAVICASPNDVIVHGIPGGRGARGGRHHLDRLRRDRRRLARRRRVHRRASGRSTPRPPRLIEVTEASLGGRHRRDGRPATGSGDIGAAVAGGGRGGRVLGGAGLRGPRHRHGHARAARRPQLRPARARARKLRPATSRRRAHGERRHAPRPGSSTTAGPWSPPTARWAAHSEHTIAVTDDGPEILTLP